MLGYGAMAARAGEVGRQAASRSFRPPGLAAAGPVAAAALRGAAQRRHRRATRSAVAGENARPGAQGAR